MAFLKFLSCFLLIAAPLVQGNPASNAVLKSTLELSVSKLLIPLGQSRSVECKPSGNPVPTVYWLKNGAEMGQKTIQSDNTLSIFDATTDDVGEYICLGMVDQRVVAQKTLKVEIDETSPKVTVAMGKLILLAGQSGSVECKAQGSPLPRVHWTKGKGRFSPRVTQSGDKLVISNAKPSDEGIYVCNGLVEGTSVWPAYVIVEIISAAPVTQAPIISTTVAAAREGAAPVTQAPIISTTVAAAREATVTPAPNSRVAVNVHILKLVKGHSGAVDCKAEGLPLPSVQWRKEGGEFGKATRQNGNTLIISNAEVSDEGNYICIGIVDGKAVFTEYVHVRVDGTSETSTQVAASTSPRVDVNAAVLKLVKGRSGAIDCNPSGTPTPKVQWIREYGDFDDRVRIVGNTLVISEVQDDDVGNYICNGVVESTVTWVDYVQVQIVENDSSESDNFYISIFDGHGSNIRCELEFVPDEHKHTGDEKELVIQIASKQRSGYQCKVFGHSLVLRQASLRLDEQTPAPPSVIVRPASPSAALGQALLVECVAAGGEGVSVRWERVGGSLSSRVQARGSTLVFHHIASEDAGSYRCIARNGGGEVSETTHIHVTNAPYDGSSPHGPKVGIKGEKLVYLHNGETRTFTCQPFGSPLPTVQWKLGEGDFRDGVRQVGKMLTITNFTESDAGNYVCDALVEATPVWTDYIQLRPFDTHLCELKPHEGVIERYCTHKYRYIRWYYNTTFKRCDQFYYSGCGGNENRFETEAACKRACDPARRNAV